MMIGDLEAEEFVNRLQRLRIDCVICTLPPAATSSNEYEISDRFSFITDTPGGTWLWMNVGVEKSPSENIVAIYA